MKRRILCFGDSNTYGVIPRWAPSPLPSERYDENTRWTSVLAQDLGHEWTIIEEGLGGRTTMYQIPDESYRLGIWYLKPCMLSHRPLDYVIIMLGTNDLQPRMHTEPFGKEQLHIGIEKLIKIAQSLPQCGPDFKPPKILILAPPPTKAAKGREDVFLQFGGHEGVELSHHFAPVYRQVAEKYGCGFLDAALYAVADDGDGVHFSRQSHPVLGHAVADAIQKMEAEREGGLGDAQKLERDFEM